MVLFVGKKCIFVMRYTAYEKEIALDIISFCLDFEFIAAAIFRSSGRPNAIMDVSIAAFGGHCDGVVD